MRNIENIRKTYDYFIHYGNILKVVDNNFDGDNYTTKIIKCDELTIQFEMKNGVVTNMMNLKNRVF